jgi:hypothetical protein
LLSNIYRSPTSSSNDSNLTQLESFNRKLDNFLHDLYNQHAEVFVFSDSNINLLKITNSNPVSDYISTIHSNVFLQLISKATRIAGESYSLIDHILCKSFNPNFITGSLLLDISDHFLTFLSVPENTNDNSRPAESNKTRNFSLENMRAFKAALQNLCWHELYACNNTDASFKIFWDIFNSLFNLHFPLSTRKFNRNIHPKNKFMTPGLLVSRNNKIKLHALSISKPTLFLQKYKQYRNKIIK